MAASLQGQMATVAGGVIHQQRRGQGDIVAGLQGQRGTAVKDLGDTVGMNGEIGGRVVGKGQIA